MKHDIFIIIVYMKLILQGKHVGNNFHYPPWHMSIFNYTTYKFGLNIQNHYIFDNTSHKFKVTHQ